MIFVEPVKDSKTEYIVFDFKNSTIERKNNQSELPDDNIYCFDLYGMYSVFDKKLPFILDLQMLSGLCQNRVDALPEMFELNLKNSFRQLESIIDAHIKSYESCNIVTNNFSLDQLIPKAILDKYYKCKSLCIRNLIQNTFFDPDVVSFYKNNYSKIKSVLALSNNPIIINNEESYIKYNIFGAKNSRLSIRKESVNVFNIPKDKRSCVASKKGHTLCQFDFKSFQPRLAFSIFGDENIKQKLRDSEDIYLLFEGDREQNKIELISWMFSKRNNEKFDNTLAFIKQARTSLYENQKGKKVLNFFNRPLFFSDEEENVVFQNYICSVEVDCLFSLIRDIQLEFEGSRSYLILPFHDCLIFSIHDEELVKIFQLKKFMEQYLYDAFKVNFPVSVKIGKNFAMLENFNEKSLQMQ